MGTPHAGSHVADLNRVRVLKAIAGATFKKPPEKLINALSAYSGELQDLSASFERTTIFTQHLIEICTYYETKTTRFTGKEEVIRFLDRFCVSPSTLTFYYPDCPSVDGCLALSE